MRTAVLYIYIYIVKVTLTSHVVTLCFTNADGDGNLQTGHRRHRRMSQRAEVNVTLTVLAIRLRY